MRDQDAAVTGLLSRVEQGLRAGQAGTEPDPGNRGDPRAFSRFLAVLRMGKLRRMDGLIAIAFTALLVAPLHFAVLSYLARLDGGTWLREVGVIILDERALEGQAEVIGTYAGAPIRAAVTFKGLEYRYTGITTPKRKERMGPDELYLEPGLLYQAQATA